METRHFDTLRMLCGILRKPSDNVSFEEEKLFTVFLSAQILVKVRITAQDRTKCLLWKGLRGRTSAVVADRSSIIESTTITLFESTDA